MALQHDSDRVLPHKAQTLLIHNIPRQYDGAMFLAELSDLIPGHPYDFVFIPWDVRRKKGAGFGFLNFRSPQLAADYRAFLTGHLWRRAPQNPPLHASYAWAHGLVRNLAIIAVSTNVHGKQHLSPMVFDAFGNAVPFLHAVRVHCPRHILELAKQWHMNRWVWYESTSEDAASNPMDWRGAAQLDKISVPEPNEIPRPQFIAARLQ